MRGGRIAASHSESSLRKLQGRRVRCGQESRRRFARLLGLDRDPMPYGVANVRWIEDRVELGIVGEGLADSVEIILDATRDDFPAFLSGPEVCLWFRQPEIPPRLATLLRQASQNLVRLRFLDLARAVVLDPESEPEEDGGGAPAPDGISTPTASQHAWTHAAIYADFFAAPELRRAGCDIIDVHNTHTQVCHGDVECSYCAVCVPRPRTALLRLPVYETVRNIGRLPEGQGLFNESEDLSEIISSDMTEQDVILGAPGRIEQVLRHADRVRRKDRLLVIGACLPDVIGEDQDAAAAAFAARTQTPVVMVPAAPRSWAWFARDMLQTRRSSLVGDARIDPRGVNLIGFASNRGTRELGERLGSLGVRVNTRVLPELNTDAVDLVVRGALNVYMPNVHWEEAYGYLQDDDLRRHLSLEGPYGVEGTRSWLQRVCGALSVSDPSTISERCDAWMETLLGRWNRLRDEARTYRLGVVVADEQVATLFDPRFTWGIALLPMLREMGFGLDVLVGGANCESAMRRFRSQTSLRPEDYAIDTFDSLPSLMDALIKSPCRAVFSNYVFDWRLVQAGKAPFSTLELEMGFEGAVSSLERLIAVCRIPLFQAGRRFMNKVAPAGYDDGR